MANRPVGAPVTDQDGHGAHHLGNGIGMVVKGLDRTSSLPSPEPCPVYR